MNKIPLDALMLIGGFLTEPHEVAFLYRFMPEHAILEMREMTIWRLPLSNADLHFMHAYYVASYDLSAALAIFNRKKICGRIQ
jgi:hypothetical protein